MQANGQDRWTVSLAKLAEYIQVAFPKRQKV